MYCQLPDVLFERIFVQKISAAGTGGGKRRKCGFYNGMHMESPFIRLTDRPSVWAYQKDRLVGIALGILHDVRIGAVNILEKVHKNNLLSCSWQTDSSAGDMSIRFVSEIFLCKIF